MDGFLGSLLGLDLDLDDSGDHLFGARHFADAYAGMGLLRSVSPTSCPPGVTPAGEETYELPASALRAVPLPSIDLAGLAKPRR